LANGDSRFVSGRRHFDDSTNLTIPALLRFQSKKGKKGEETWVKICAVPTQQTGGKMKRRNTKRKKQDCDVEKVIDTIEKAASAAKQIYRAAEPVIRRVLKSGTKTK
jgi:hypothetical protein